MEYSAECSQCQTIFQRSDQAGEVDVVGVELRQDEDPTAAGAARFLPGPAGVDFDAGMGVDGDQRRLHRRSAPIIWPTRSG